MLLRRTKKDHFENFNLIDFSDSNKFWKKIVPYFRKRRLNSNKMLLKEKLALDEKQLASIMNKLFINITKNLNLKKDRGIPPVTLEVIFKKLFFIQVLKRLEKLIRAIKIFLYIK